MNTADKNNSESRDNLTRRMKDEITISMMAIASQKQKLDKLKLEINE